MFLFAPVTLISKRYGSESVLDRSSSLGSAKPAVLESAELVAWKAMFKVAVGEIYPEEILDVLIRELPWKMIEQVSPEDAKWFVLEDKQPPPSHNLHDTIESHTAVVQHMDQQLLQLISAGNPTSSSTASFSAQTVEVIMDLLAKSIKEGGAVNPSLPASHQLASPPNTTDVAMTDEEGAVHNATNIGEDLDIHSNRTTHPVNNESFGPLRSTATTNETDVMRVDPSKHQYSIETHNKDNVAMARDVEAASIRGTPEEQVGVENSVGKPIDSDNDIEQSDSMPASPAVTARRDGSSAPGPGRSPRSRSSSQEGRSDRHSSFTLSQHTTLPLFIKPTDSQDDRSEFADNENRSQLSDDERPSDAIPLTSTGILPNTEPHEGRQTKRRLKRGDDIYTETEDEDNTEGSNGSPVTPSNRRGTIGLAYAINQSHISTPSISQTDESEQELSSTGAKRKRRKGKEDAHPARTGASVPKGRRSRAKRTTKRLSPVDERETPDEEERPSRKKRKRSKVVTVDRYIEEMGRLSVDPEDMEKYALFTSRLNSEQPESKPGSIRSMSSLTKRYTTNTPIRVWDAKRQMQLLAPVFHFEDELVNFLHLMDSVERGFVDGQPRFSSRPEHSTFKVLHYDAYRRLTGSEIGEILQHQILVVYDMPWEEVTFEHDIGDIVSSDALIDVQDNSLDHRASGMSRLVKTTRKEFMDNVEAGDRSKALNALSLRMTSSHYEDDKQASCRIAWHNTKELKFDSNLQFPSSDVYWALMSTKGAVTHWHLDADGMGTVVDVVTGSKLWIAASDQAHKFDRIGVLLSPGFALDRAPTNFKTEAILLDARTRMIMGPNRLHTVYTPEPTTCRGSHFYSIHTMQATLSSLVHGFVCHKFINNASHPEARVLLHRLVHFCHRGLVEKIDMTSKEKWHLPAVAAEEGADVAIDEVLNLLSLCALSILANALDPRTYLAVNQKEDEVQTEEQEAVIRLLGVNAVPRSERTDICRSRGAAMELIEWTRNNLRFELEGEEVDLPSEYFVAVGLAILKYKLAADTNSIESSARCTMEHLRAELDCSYEMDMRSHNLWRKRTNGDRWITNELKCEDNILLPDAEASDQPIETLPHPPSENGITVVEKTINMFAEHVYADEEPTQWRNEVIGLSEKNRYTAKRVLPGASEYQQTTDWLVRGTRAPDDTYFNTMRCRDAMATFQDKDFIDGLLDMLRDTRNT